MATLEQIRAKLKALEKNRQNNNEDGDLIFPHWNIEETATLRFLPDGDTTNDFFWRERQLMNLSFPGIKGGETAKSITIKVPCPEMFGDVCPVHAELRKWFDSKDPDLDQQARNYWKKRSYLMQGFVIDSDLKEDRAPENPIRKFIFTPQLFNIVKSALLDPELEYVPTDYKNGLNFIVSKTKSGVHSNYATSKYARRETALTDEQKTAIETHGLFSLSDWLPNRPSADHINAIYEMWQASVNNELYDPDRWSQYYRPYGLTQTTEARSSHEDQAEPAPAPKVSTPPNAEAAPKAPVESAVGEEPSAQAGSKSASDILARIRARNNG